MSQTKKAVISLTEEEYSMLCAMSEDGSAESFVKKLVEETLRTQRLKDGYAEMAQINLELAQMCFDADEQTLKRYEEELSKN